MRNKIFLLIAIISAGLLAGCSRPVAKTVMTERIVHDTIYRSVGSRERDTLIATRFVGVSAYDSIAPVVDSAGRVVAYDRWHVRTTRVAGQSIKSRDAEKGDTLQQSTVASIASDRQERNQEKKSSGWMVSAAIAMGAGLAGWLIGRKKS